MNTQFHGSDRLKIDSNYVRSRLETQNVDIVVHIFFGIVNATKTVKFVHNT